MEFPLPKVPGVLGIHDLHISQLSRKSSPLPPVTDPTRISPELAFIPQASSSNPPRPRSPLNDFLLLGSHVGGPPGMLRGVRHLARHDRTRGRAPAPSRRDEPSGEESVCGWARVRARRRRVDEGAEEDGGKARDTGGGGELRERKKRGDSLRSVEYFLILLLSVISFSLIYFARASGAPSVVTVLESSALPVTFIPP